VPRSSAPPTTDDWLNLHIVYANAMWTWASIETLIFRIYVAAIGGLTGDMRPLQRKFFSDRVFRRRLRETHAKMEQRWSGTPHFDRWQALSERCEKANDERGRIAHLAGYPVNPQRPGQRPLYVLLEPPWHHRHPVTWGEAKSTGFDFKKLSQFAYKWHKLRADLDRFGLILWSEERSPKRSS
jgi:hypothetical protein